MEIVCLVCGETLFLDEKSYCCKNNHRFDLSRKGALNLLQSSAKGKHHGDDKLMVRSRSLFLNKGYYDSLSNAICDLLVNELPDESCIIDAGCGEGKYTVDLLNSIREHGKEAEILGIDISKDAISALRSRSKEIMGIVSSASRIPVRDRSADAVLNIFSPLISIEFSRVLKESGLLLRVVPQEKHLMELKQAVYDNPYANPHESGHIPGFRIKERKDVEYSVLIKSNEDIVSLFQMTPYYYKTSRKDQEKLSYITELSVTFSFAVFLYSKEQEG
ncbi:MAG: methyltransferase domain-containing protein [Oscillospiraceae bacterium]|nr:methyltransferase domain-containing protein [Oscillospiraceae bacterium]MBR0452171.1 methyltransferase domain-containing protein [Oscillospiraceae bacterium]